MPAVGVRRVACGTPADWMRRLGTVLRLAPRAAACQVSIGIYLSPPPLVCFFLDCNNPTTTESAPIRLPIRPPFLPLSTRPTQANNQQCAVRRGHHLHCPRFGPIVTYYRDPPLRKHRGPLCLLLPFCTQGNVTACFACLYTQQPAVCGKAAPPAALPPGSDSDPIIMRRFRTPPMRKHPSSTRRLLPFRTQGNVIACFACVYKQPAV